MKRILLKPLSPDDVLHLQAHSMYVAAVVSHPSPHADEDFLKRIPTGIVDEIARGYRRMSTTAKKAQSPQAQTGQQDLEKLGVQMAVESKLKAQGAGLIRKSFWMHVYSNPAVQAALKAIMEREKCKPADAQKLLRGRVSKRILRMKRELTKVEKLIASPPASPVGIKPTTAS